MNSQSFGQILKTARAQKGIDLKTAANETKIQQKYLLAMEEENESEFITQVQLRGFLLKYAQYLNLDFERLYAVYRRDFGVSEKKTSANRKKKWLNIQKQYLLPSLAGFVLGFIGLILLTSAISRSFTLPRVELTSPISLESPFDGFIVTDKDSAVLEGRIVDEGVVRVNGEAIPTDASGVFKTASLPLKEGDNRFEVKLTNSLNREGMILINILKVNNDELQAIPEPEG